MSLVHHTDGMFAEERQTRPLSRGYGKVKMGAGPPLGGSEGLEKCLALKK